MIKKTFEVWHEGEREYSSVEIDSVSTDPERLRARAAVLFVEMEDPQEAEDYTVRVRDPETGEVTEHDVEAEVEVSVFSFGRPRPVKAEDVEPDPDADGEDTFDCDDTGSSD